MALTNLMKTARLAKLLDGASLPVLHGIEAATQSWLVGAFLIDDDAGSIIEATSPLASTGKGISLTLGLATNAAKGVTGADVLFDKASDDTVFEMNLSDATAGTHTLVQADAWSTYAVTKDSTSGNWYLDANAEATTGGGVVVGFKDPVGTVDARVYVILTHNLIGNADLDLF